MLRRKFVTALVRNVEKARRIFPSGVRFVKGDLQNLDSIKESIKQADGIYISIANTHRDKEDKFNAEMHGLDNILSVAKDLKIKQVVFLSSFIARNYKGDGGYSRQKRSGIDRVKTSAIPYNILPFQFYGKF